MKTSCSNSSPIHAIAPGRTLAPGSVERRLWFLDHDCRRLGHRNCRGGVAGGKDFRALNRLQSEMQQGMLPAKALGDGALIFLVAGLLLVTPGVLTDCFGLALLMPPFRPLVMKGVRHWLAKHVRVQSVNF